LIEHKELIISVSEVYLSEPAVNWTKLRKHRPQDSLGECSEEDELWMPMKIIKDKLNQVNPAQIMLEELQSNQSKTVSSTYTKVLKTGREEMLKKTRLNEEEIVTCLLNLATDKKILTTLFAGWCSWV